MSEWSLLECGLHESSLRSGPCWRCELAAREIATHVVAKSDEAPIVAEPRRHAAVVRTFRRRGAMPGTRSHRATPEVHDAVVARALAGESVGKLAKAYGFSRAAVYLWLDKARKVAA